MDEAQLSSIPDKPQLIIGAQVIRHGDYEWQGVVCSVFSTPHGLKRIVVAHRVDIGYVLHIYRPEELSIVITERQKARG